MQINKAEENPQTDRRKERQEDRHRSLWQADMVISNNTSIAKCLPKQSSNKEMYFPDATASLTRGVTSIITVWLFCHWGGLFDGLPAPEYWITQQCSLLSLPPLCRTINISPISVLLLWAPHWTSSQKSEPASLGQWIPLSSIPRAVCLLQTPDSWIRGAGGEILTGDDDVHTAKALHYKRCLTEKNFSTMTSTSHVPVHKRYACRFTHTLTNVWEALESRNWLAASTLSFLFF